MGIFRSGIDLDEINKRWLPPFERSFGVKITEIGERSLSAEFTVTEALLQPYGIMHGGISCVLSESLGSMAGALAVPEGKTVVGQSLHAVYIRPAKLHTLVHARAEARHLGSRSHVWEILLQDKAQVKDIAKITLSLMVVDIDGALKPV